MGSGGAVFATGPGRAAFIPSLCKNGDATGGGAHLHLVDRAEGVQGEPRARWNVQQRDGWAVGETKKNDRPVTANAIRARIEDQRSYFPSHAANNPAVIVAIAHARIHAS